MACVNILLTTNNDKKINNMQVQGKLISKGEHKSGRSKAGKEWQMMDFTIAKKDVKYPSEIDIKTFNGDVIMFINDTTIGTELQVEIDIESKTNEWKDKATGEPRSMRRTEVKAFRVEVLRVDDMQVNAGVTQANQMYQAPPPPVQQGDDDDLPF